MSIPVSELRRWLETIPNDEEVGIDDDGLSLQVVGDSQTYLEVGGLPILLENNKRDQKMPNIPIKLEEVKNTPDGVWNGKYIWHSWSLAGETQGVLGRGATKEQSISDWLRRASDDGHKVSREALNITHIRIFNRE